MNITEHVNLCHKTMKSGNCSTLIKAIGDLIYTGLIQSQQAEAEHLHVTRKYTFYCQATLLNLEALAVN